MKVQFAILNGFNVLFLLTLHYFVEYGLRISTWNYSFLGSINELEFSAAHFVISVFELSSNLRVKNINLSSFEKFFQKSSSFDNGRS